MRQHWIKLAILTILPLLLAASLIFAGAAQRGGRGQAPAGPDIPIPRLADGTPNLGWDDPRYKGAWRSGMHWEYGKDQLDPKAREEGLPYQPWAKALHDFRQKTESKDDPEVFCLPAGGPRATSTQGAWEFIQLPQQKRIIRIFQEIAHMYQIIYMDGRPHPPEANEFPTWLGHSVGHWEGDTLVVDTVGFNEGHWLDRSGDVRTSKTHLVERFTRTSYSNLRYEATIDDPGAYTKPFTIGWDVRWVPPILRFRNTSARKTTATSNTWETFKSRESIRSCREGKSGLGSKLESNFKIATKPFTETRRVRASISQSRARGSSARNRKPS